MIVYLKSAFDRITTMTNVMLDLETLSTRPNAAIIIIGAIKFSDNMLYNEELTDSELQKMDIFYRRISLEPYFSSSSKYNVDEETILWWEKQDEDISYEALFHPDRTSLNEALQEFINWIGPEKNNVKIWGNGSCFDVTILEEALKLEGLETCWNFWMVRDLRTLMDIGKTRMKDLPDFKKHHAIWDCYRQIIGYQRSMQNLKKLR